MGTKISDIELIQNTEIFESCLNGYGLFGIVYSYHLMIEDAYFLKKNVCITNWHDLSKLNGNYTKRMQIR